MAQIITLQDGFGGSSLSALWTSTGTAVVSNNQVVITSGAASDYQSIRSASTFDLTGNSACVQVLDTGNQSLVSHEANFQLQLDGSNLIWMPCSQNNVAAYKLVAGTQTQIGSTIPFSNATRWLRFRELSGTIYFETSPDCGTWTTQWTVANPWAVTALTAVLQSDCWQTEASGSYATFGHFNMPFSEGINRHIRVGNGMSVSGVAN